MRYKLPKVDIKKLASAGLSRSAIAAALGINEKYFEAALKKDEAFTRLIDRLALDHYIAIEESARCGHVDPGLYQYWTQTKWQHFYPQHNTKAKASLKVMK